MAGASSPLALLWKDTACSRYLLDTDPSGVVPPLQVSSDPKRYLPWFLPYKRQPGWSDCVRQVGREEKRC